jgi:ABC-type glycerol-3-phosphate transport system permease component
VLFVLSSALKSSGEVFSDPWTLPSSPRFSNFATAWSQGNLDAAFLNSSIVTVGTIGLTLLFAVPAAYALACLKLPWRGVIYLLVLVPIIIPSEVLLLPLFLMFRFLGLLNSLEGLVLINTGLNASLATVLLSQFFAAIPRELRESAQVDGAGRMRVLWSVVLPMSRTGLIATVVLVGVFTWNEYFYSLVVVQRPQLFTIQLAMGNFSTAYATDYGLLFAALALSILPPLIIFVILQRQFTAGLTTGALRG